MEDWKDKLGAAFGLDADAARHIDPVAEPARGDALAQQGRRAVHVVVERKGRRGKTATIITDLVADDNALVDLAALLKRQLGVGGSARGGEILLQGDFRQRVSDILSDLGFNIK